MLFDILLGSPIVEKRMKVNSREAVRAVILKGDKILLIHSNKGDYKFPGGGVEQNEMHVEALLREIREETGYVNCIVKEKVGIVVERNTDQFEENTYFQMTSHYYLCELITDKKIIQKLDDYEHEQQFTPKWITIDMAIEENRKLMNLPDMNKWIEREILVLEELKRNLIS